MRVAQVEPTEDRHVSMFDFRAILALELRILRRDIMMIVMVVAVPLLMMVILRRSFAVVLAAFEEGPRSGAEQVVPGMIFLFSLFMVGFIGFAFLREHGWKTWDRLRASPARGWAIMAAKLLPHFIFILFQFHVLMLFGIILLNFEIDGSFLTLSVIGTVWAAFLVSLGAAVVAVSNSPQQVNVFSSLSGMVLGGLGGALVPVRALPNGLRQTAPISPVYWAIRAVRSVVEGGDSLSIVVSSCVVMLAFATLLSFVALSQFRLDTRKLI